MTRLHWLALGGLVAVGLSTATVAQDDAPHPVTPEMRGAACSHCHDGPHDTEAKSFDACGECHDTAHWAPSTFTVANHATLAFALEGKHEAVRCQACHPSARLSGLPDECAGCHIDRHRGILGETCTECHSVQQFKPVEGFAHDRTGFALSGKHAAADCAACHTGDNGNGLRQGKGPACDTCHTPSHGDFGGECSSCHDPDNAKSFAAARTSFDHRTTGFDLERRHSTQTCNACHEPGGSKPDSRCSSCHVSPHKGQLGGQCQDCHRPDRWTLARFDHDLTGWTLRGRHAVAPCSTCHTNQRWVGLTTECWDCHAADAARAPGSVDAHRFGRSDCTDCHNAWRWSF